MHWTEGIKNRVEKRTGLAFSDALNVAMFLLTMAGLLVAGLGVVIALWAYEDAQKSGDKQLTALNNAGDSLNKVTDKLQQENKILANLLDTSGDQLQASKDQLEASNKLVDKMNKGTETWNQQLLLAKAERKHREEQEARHPEITGFLKCETGWATDRLYPVSLDLQLRDVTERSGAVHLTFLPVVVVPSLDNPADLRLRVNPSASTLQRYTCGLALYNDGTIPLEDASVSTTVTMSDDKIRMWHGDWPLMHIVINDDQSKTESWSGQLVQAEHAKLRPFKETASPTTYFFEIELADEMSESYPFYLIIDIAGTGGGFRRSDAVIRVTQTR